jgi:chromosome segregation ATPase
MTTTVPLTNKEAAALLRRAQSELHVLLQLTPALQTIEKAVLAFDTGQAEAACCAGQLKDLAHDIANATAQKAEADQQRRAAEARRDDAIGAYKTEERKLASLTAKRGKIEQLEQLDAEIAEKWAKVATLNADLDALRLKFAV